MMKLSKKLLVLASMASLFSITAAAECPKGAFFEIAKQTSTLYTFLFNESLPSTCLPYTILLSPKVKDVVFRSLRGKCSVGKIWIGGVYAFFESENDNDNDKNEDEEEPFAGGEKPPSECMSVTEILSWPALRKDIKENYLPEVDDASEKKEKMTDEDIKIKEENAKITAENVDLIAKAIITYVPKKERNFDLIKFLSFEHPSMPKLLIDALGPKELDHP